MKYVKPEAEIIDIENEDIIAASCQGGPNGSNSCLNSGNTNQQNNYDMMVAKGLCKQGSEGKMGSDGLFGAQCGLAAAGVVCSRNPGTYRSAWCTSFLGIGQGNNCGALAGANSL